MAPHSNSDLLNLTRLVNTVQQLSLAVDIQEVMQIVRTVARELTGADGATFVLKDENLCYYADEDAIAPLWKGSRFPMEICVSGWVMLNKKPAVVPDINKDDRILKEIYGKTFVKSLAIVPIRTLQPLGAIGNYWAAYHQPTIAEVNILQALADVTAVAIENVNFRSTLEEKVKERTKELLESLNKEIASNEMKSAFVSMASHELQTPLSAILSSATLAEKYSKANQQNQQEKHLLRIKASANNLVNLLNDFLSVDKLQHGKVSTTTEYFELGGFLRDVITEVDSMRKEGQFIHYTNLGSVHVALDKQILHNLMLNLLSNALKYSDKDVNISVNTIAGKTIIKVEDKGIGIPEQQQKHLFEKFFRASNANNIFGTGLGLYIVKHYVELLGGTIDFVSKENVGTTFTITLVNKIIY